MPYLDYLAAGILAQSALFVAIFYGISAIWERDLGVLQRYLASPAPRSALVLGKAISAGVRALSQAVIVYILSLLLGVGIALNPLNMLGVAAAIIVGSGLFSTAFIDHRLHRQDARTVHGYRTGADNADLFCQQCDPYIVINAGMVARSVTRQPFDL
ncbi:ABC transporter permease [Bradyrhizobium sp. CCBAU 51745]|uniref:ABC transporter permease n=1 Tax=Bradyrhizobium sp. CCBAU 51745 TaxID=1325099 RepID=UPI0023057B27|nr:ABC transporter permease [Bradyrhizobium sp. CCBAU 51745]